MVEVGSLVVCEYRLPSRVQPWVSPMWLGQVVAPSASWTIAPGSRMSEAAFCAATGRVKVQYRRAGREPEFTEFEQVDRLRLVPAGFEGWTFEARLCWALGEHGPSAVEAYARSHLSLIDVWDGSGQVTEVRAGDRVLARFDRGDVDDARAFRDQIVFDAVALAVVESSYEEVFGG